MSDGSVCMKTYVAIMSKRQGRRLADQWSVNIDKQAKAGHGAKGSSKENSLGLPPLILKSVVQAYGPGILDLACQPDEYVGIQDMVDSAQVMGKTLQNLLLA